MPTLTRLITILLTAAVSMLAYGENPFVVVLDPGHGGHDSGCVGIKAKEKDIVLNVSNLLKDKIEAAFPEDVKVVTTRSTDKFIPLGDRAKIANAAGGNLFISIHVNSVDKKNKNRASVAGAQVYTCGTHRNQSNLEVAMRENSVLSLESDDSQTYQGFDPTSAESYIMFELSQNQHQRQSIQFAQIAQNSLIKHAGRANKDIHQAGFLVLWSTAMPSVLVELDFICNPKQEEFLNSEAGQEKCAEALFKAFKEFYSSKQ